MKRISLGKKAKLSPLRRLFSTCTNKTTPLTVGEQINLYNDMPQRVDCDPKIFQVTDNHRSREITLDPLRLQSAVRQTRPFTAPENLSIIERQSTISKV